MLGNRIKFLSRKLLNKIASNQGYTLVPTAGIGEPSVSKNLTDGDRKYLQFDNPRLLELIEKYAAIDSDVTVPVVWEEGIIDKDALRYFRGENAYVWQSRSGNSEINYALTTYYMLSGDKQRFLKSLKEDDSFGVNTFEIAGKTISRDLLDSIHEISFLEKHLDIFNSSKLNILDIGAGYGRLAHRMCEAVTNLEGYYCVDAIPVSTFLCEYYLRYRKVDNKAQAIPLHELESLNGKNINLAINIHSFSECSPSAIDWWCKFIAGQGIKHLMIVPNPGNHGGSKLATTPGEHDFMSIIENAGYKLIVKETKYDDPCLQRSGIFPTYYYLFELS